MGLVNDLLKAKPEVKLKGIESFKKLGLAELFTATSKLDAERIEVSAHPL